MCVGLAKERFEELWRIFTIVSGSLRYTRGKKNLRAFTHPVEYDEIKLRAIKEQLSGYEKFVVRWISETSKFYRCDTLFNKFKKDPHTQET